MIGVRLFANLRKGREKVYFMKPDTMDTVQDVIDRLDIPRNEVNILLINRFRQKPKTEIIDEDIVSLFPVVGGS